MEVRRKIRDGIFGSGPNWGQGWFDEDLGGYPDKEVNCGYDIRLSLK